MTAFLLYGATGYVGEATARLALAGGLRPVIAGRDATRLAALGEELGVEHRVARLDDSSAVDRALAGLPLVLNCAGPFIHTYAAVADACLRVGTHYLDITGEIPVLEGLLARDAMAKARRVMLLPSVGFDVVPTDCLAVHLAQRLPTATHLALAFRSEGPAGLPPGTQRTAIELLPFGDRVRRDGKLERPAGRMKTRMIDFGKGPVLATQLTWGDGFTAWHSTGIPNIEDYVALPRSVRRQLAMMATLRPLFRLKWMRQLAEHAVKPGPSPERRARATTHVWGEASTEDGRRVTARLHGPEAGLEWTARAALAAVRKALTGNAPPGFQTPARAYGPDFVLEVEGVTREDLD